jgi:hypothetical protein
VGDIDQGAIVGVDRCFGFAEEGRMTLQARQVGTRLLLILALVAALLAGIVAVGWAMSYGNVAHAIGTSSHPQYMAPAAGGDSGGGRLRTGPVGNDSGGGR